MQDTPFEAAVDPVVLASLATERAAHIVEFLNEQPADHAAALLSQPDIDGGLIGGASLKAPDFLQIIAAARSRPRLLFQGATA